MKIKKMLLPLLLVILAGCVEIAAILLCRNMIPDFKNEVFTDQKNISTLPMFVTDEDDSRFYPMLEYYNSDKCISYKEFASQEIKSLMADKSFFQYFYENPEEIGVQVQNIEDADADEIYGFYQLCHNNAIRFIVTSFDGEEVLPDDTDFTRNAVINSETSDLYIKDFELKGKDGKTRLLDLAFGLYSRSVLYYRLRSKNTDSADTNEINQLSRRLIRDAEDIMPHIYDYLPYSTGESTDDTNIYDGIIAEDEFDENQKYAYTNSGEPDNILLNFFRRIREKDILYLSDTLYPSDYYKDENVDFLALNVLSEDEKYGMNIRIPVYPDKDEYNYNVFSNGDELILLVSSGRSSAYSGYIFYYSMTDQKITGFSIISS